jgi:predicted dehydrogenase
VEKVRCGIVGLGRIGSLLEEDRLREKPCTHAGAIAANGDCVLAGGCDIDERRRGLFSARWRCRAVFSDFEEMLEKTSPEILSIATPPATHLGLVERALPHGVKVIVCEKPLAADAADAGRIDEIHGSGRVKILTNHQRRYSRDYVLAKERVCSGSFGPLLTVSSKLFMGEAGSVTDVFLDDGTHLVDILRYLTGSELEDPAVRLAGDAGTFPPGKDRGVTLFVESSAGRVPVLMEIGTGRDYVQFELDLCFASGRIRIGNGLFEEYAGGESPYYERMRSLLKLRARRPAKTGYFSNMLKDAVLCARDPKREPRSSARDGYLALRFIDAVKTATGD